MKETILGIKISVFMLSLFALYNIVGLAINRYLTVDNLFTIFLISTLISSFIARLLEEAIFRVMKKALNNKGE